MKSLIYLLSALGAFAGMKLISCQAQQRTLVHDSPIVFSPTVKREKCVPFPQLHITLVQPKGDSAIQISAESYKVLRKWMTKVEQGWNQNHCEAK